MPCAAAPVGDRLDEARGEQLRAEAEQGVARRGGVRADVVPQRRVEQHRAAAMALLEALVERRRPRPPALDPVKRRLVVEGAVDGRAEVFGKRAVVLLVGQVDELLSPTRVEIVDQIARPVGHADEEHDLPRRRPAPPRQTPVADLGRQVQRVRVVSAFMATAAMSSPGGTSSYSAPGPVTVGLHQVEPLAEGFGVPLAQAVRPPSRWGTRTRRTGTSSGPTRAAVSTACL